MDGIGLICFILGVVAALSLMYFAAWWFCAANRMSSREGHYILNPEMDDEDMDELKNGTKLYTGLGEW